MLSSLGWNAIRLDAGLIDRAFHGAVNPRRNRDAGVQRVTGHRLAETARAADSLAITIRTCETAQTGSTANRPNEEISI
jgi:hypothetical protein